MTARDIVFVVITPLILAEVGPWCGWLAARLLPWAATLRYGDTDRAAMRLEEWSGDLDEIPGQLTKLAYAAGQLVAGSAVSARRIARTITRTPNARTPNAHLGGSLSALVEGELSHEERDRLYVHLAACAECRAEAAALRALRRRLGALGDAAIDGRLLSRLISLAEPGEPPAAPRI